MGLATKPAPSGIEGPEVTPLGPGTGWQHPWLRINRLLREMIHAYRDREARAILKRS